MTDDDLSSPSSKLSKLDSSALADDKTDAISRTVSKIANADHRLALEQFFAGNFTKPPNVQPALWNLLSGFGELLKLVVDDQTDIRESSRAKEIPMEIGSGSNDGTWAQVVSGRRKRTRHVSNISNSSTIVPLQVQSQSAALEEAERLRSAVVLHLSEPKNSDPIQKEKDDDYNVRKLINSLDPTAKIDKLYRMGKISDRARPIKIVFCTKSMQRAVLLNAKSLRNHSDYGGVYIRKSLTLEERRNYNLQWAALKYLRGINKEWVIYRDEFWLRNEIGSTETRTVPPDIPPHVFSSNKPGGGSSRTTNTDSQPTVTGNE